MMQRKGKRVYTYTYIQTKSLHTHLSGVVSTSYSSQKRDVAIKRKI